VTVVVARLAQQALGTATTGSLTALVAGGAVLAVGYLALVRRMRVPEVDALVGPVLSRLR
jgi:hypothetical protein